MGYLTVYLQRLDQVLLDKAVIEISINADGKVWIERAGSTHMTAASIPALSPIDVKNLATQIANSSTNRFGADAPLVSATVTYLDLMLRCQIVGEPAAAGGTIIGIRVFREGMSKRAPRKFHFLRDQGISLEEERRALVDGIRAKALTDDVGAFLKVLIDQRLNVIVSGGTSTGKTELGRNMLDLVSPDERILTIEDSLELNPEQANTVRLIAQRAEGSPRSAEKLLQASLRLRPDRIILGELRGAEAATFLDAINTGHSGSFTTIHAHSARKAMDRLALLVMAQGTKLSFPEVIRYLETSIDVIVQMGRVGEKRGILETYFPGVD